MPPLLGAFVRASADAEWYGGMCHGKSALALGLQRLLAPGPKDSCMWMWSTTILYAAFLAINQCHIAY